MERDERAVQAGVFTSLPELVAIRASVQARQRRSRQRSKGIMPGDTASRQRGTGKTFEEIRPYRPGDDIRQIDWRVSARTRQTQLRVYAADRERPVHVVVDQRSAMFFGSQGRFKSVMAAHCAAIVAWQTTLLGEPLIGHIISDLDVTNFRCQRSNASTLRFLRGLDDANHRLSTSHPSVALSSALSQVSARLHPGARIVIVSDWHDYDDNCRVVLQRMRRRQPITLLKIVDPIERTMRVSGQLGISDGRQRTVLNANRAFRLRYQQRRTTVDRAFEAQIQDAGIALQQVNTTDSLTRPLDYLVNS